MSYKGITPSMITFGRSASYVPKGKKKAVKQRKEVASKAYVKQVVNKSHAIDFFRASNSTGASYDVPIIYAVDDIPQGDGEQQRVGDQVEPVSLKIRGTFTCSAVTDICRIVIVQWKVSSATATPTIADVLGETATSTTVYASHNIEPLDRKKFKILLDRTYYNKTGSSSELRPFNLNVTKFSNKYVNYTSAATTGIYKIYMILFSNVANAGSKPTATYKTQLEYRETM